MFVAGCGGSRPAASNEDAVRTAADQFTAAIAQGNNDAACGYLTPELDEKLTVGALSQHCILPDLGSAVISKVTVTGETAIVAFENTNVILQLKRDGSDWKIADF